MHDMIRTTLATAALALLAASPLTRAMDTETDMDMDNAPASAASPATSARTAPPLAAGFIKADEYRETDVWGRIRSGYAIPDLDNSLVSRHTQWYASRPDNLKRISGRASPYLYHIVQELEKRGMPTELALLPVIESAFNPLALSTADAAGLWQFVPGTGKDYNLKQNMFKDERRGVLASTDAALTYLQRLYTMFGDWQLALAAYNWGEGNIQRIIKKNQELGKGTDFDSLAELMPLETRNYVPKLQAVKNIVASPSQYNVVLPAIDNQPYFTAVDKTSDIDLAVAAQLAEMSLDEFKALNPQFKKPVITGGEKTKILLPKENAEKFHLNLAQWGRELSTWTTHKITGARVSIAALASKFGTTPEVIRQANNIPAKSTLKAGSTILVPKVSASSAGDIAENIIENAVVAFEAERSPRVKAQAPSRYKAKASTSDKKRISRNTSAQRKHR
ncbi:transglycosylase SLT domain-containing protein [Massilia consociata]|uniref:Transglycosylase SLT domain-containing protein n=1 Tax=Massilia consociata TaxID=760117 RepID=A0ABV6FG29_9BURK